MTLIARLGVSVIAMTLLSPSSASELQFQLGGLRSTADSKPTYSWALEYGRPFGKHLSGSFAWLNEGHVPGHRRDGQAAQLWWHAAGPSEGPIYRFGLGPYRYFDTTVGPSPESHINAHGWGMIASADASWPLAGKWIASLRANRVHVNRDVRSTAIVGGIGYRFESAGEESRGVFARSSAASPARWELDVMGGATVSNDFHSQVEFAKAIGLRVGIADHLSGSLAYLREGKFQRGWREGIAPQIWLEDDLTDRLAVAVGIGPYLARSSFRMPDGSNAPAKSILVSISAAYIITPEWRGRLIWNRVATTYDENADVFLFAIGYRF